MSYLETSEILHQVALQYQNDMQTAAALLASMGLENRLKAAKAQVDHRDFVAMVTLMGIQGDSQDKRNLDIRNKLEELTNAFSDPNHNAREPYLNMVYNLRDTFNPKDVNMENPEQVGKLLQYSILTQTYSQKRKENPDYYNNRYTTVADRNLADSRERVASLVAERVITSVGHLGISFDCEHSLTLPKVVAPNFLPAHECCEEFEFDQLEKAIAAKENGATSDKFDLPITDNIVYYFGKAPADVARCSEDAKDNLFMYYSSCIEESLMQATSSNMQGLRELNIESAESLYIDGRPVQEFYRELNQPNGTYNRAALVIALVSGRHKIDLVHSYRDDQGQLQFAAKSLNPKVTPEQERLHLEQYHWIRRLLFNWGPFRIETLQEKIDKMHNDPAKEERHEQICNHLKERIESVRSRKEAEAKKQALKDQKKLERKAAMDKEVTRLESSVTKWEKDSVIGILGQQMIGSYSTIQKLFVHKPSERYDKIAVPFAKQVLYSQLQLERLEGNNEPGEQEKLLLGDGTKESIERNIEATAKQMAELPAFKNLVHEKFSGPSPSSSGGIELLSSKFQDLMMVGGCLRFAEEYLKIAKASSMENQQQLDNPLQKDNEMVNEQTQSVSNVMIN